MLSLTQIAIIKISYFEKKLYTTKVRITQAKSNDIVAATRPKG